MKRPAAASVPVAARIEPQEQETLTLRDRMKSRKFDKLFAAGNLPQHVLGRVEEISEDHGDETGHACARTEYEWFKQSLFGFATVFGSGRFPYPPSPPPPASPSTPHCVLFLIYF